MESRALACRMTCCMCTVCRLSVIVWAKRTASCFCPTSQPLEVILPCRSYCFKRCPTCACRSAWAISPPRPFSQGHKGLRCEDRVHALSQSQLRDVLQVGKGP